MMSKSKWFSALGDPSEDSAAPQFATITDDGSRLKVFCQDESGQALVYLSEPQRSEFIRKIKELPHDEI